MNIATILTVHNRRQKTLSCLSHLFAALDEYNNRQTEAIDLTVYMTDDGCTDGTPEAVSEAFPHRAITILQGDGSLFWAGGMRRAWQTAIDSGTPCDYYLLLNDDTNVMANVFDELFAADRYCMAHYGKKGVYSGITCSPADKAVTTYGGVVFANKTKGRQIILQPTGTPQMADMTNANILLVPPSVVREIGIFHEGYQHACADYDYSSQARKRGIPVLVTANTCGECECDHDTQKEEILRLMEMSLSERVKYVHSVVHSDKDYLLFVRRNLPFRYPQSWLMRTFRVYCPQLYYRITYARGVYQ